MSLRQSLALNLAKGCIVILVEYDGTTIACDGLAAIEALVVTSLVPFGGFSKPLRAALRQADRSCGEISCRRATSETTALGA